MSLVSTLRYSKTAPRHYQEFLGEQNRLGFAELCF